MPKRHLVFCLAIIGAAFAAVDGASAQSSCSAFHAICAQRCRTDHAENKNCSAEFCSPKLGQCRSSGCWQDAPSYGGALHCNLAKK
jgi:hypothetical protein